MKPFFGLYIHWPFCISKCPYCDFNSHVQTSIDIQAWQDAYLVELERLWQETSDKELRTIYFGGGTPSLMPPALAGSLIEKAYALWGTSPHVEITLEANPNSIEIHKLRDFKAAGINRVSIGVQSFIEEDLLFLKRAHSREEAISAIKMAAPLFDRHSFDLIYARPHQSVQAWEKELSFALSLAQDHLSLYQLTIESHTAFYTQFHRGDFTLPDEDLATDLYLATHARLQEFNMVGYEVSNFAKPGSESQHNLLYWRYDDYAGIGPGAHGRLTIAHQKRASQAYRSPQTWLTKVKEGSGTQEIRPIEAHEQIQEMLMIGLRLREGISRQAFEKKFHKTLEEIIPSSSLKPLLQEQLMERDEISIRCTLKGLLKLNAILKYLFPRLVCDTP